MGEVESRGSKTETRGDSSARVLGAISIGIVKSSLLKQSDLWRFGRGEVHWLGRGYRALTYEAERTAGHSGCKRQKCQR